MRKKKGQSPTAMHLALPATSANLGPAFDAAALAMDLYITIDARAAHNFSIRASGRDQHICEALENHLILATYRDVLEHLGIQPAPLSLRIRNDIPIGKGCGSSAAARLAGIALANHFGRMHWTDSQIIGEASRREHHPDNASACWMGGLTIARMSGEAEAQVVRILPKGKWPLLLAVPDEALSTKESRGLLPAHYSRADAVVNIQNSMFLLAAFIQGRHALLGFRARRPHPPALSRSALSAASVSAGVDRQGWSARHRSQRCWSLRDRFPRSLFIGTKDEENDCPPSGPQWISC